MKKKTGKHIVVIMFLMILTVSTGYSQTPNNNPTRPQTARLSGKIIDAKTGKPLEAASVQLKLADKDSAISGTLTKPNGGFSFENVRTSRKLRIVISAVGSKEKEVLILPAGFKSAQRDLGNIKVEESAQFLEDVVVSAPKQAALQMGIDRKTFSADKSLTSAGGTAIDLMKSIPSVSVDVDGNVQLRNASPVIFVDGRPTILSLDQIPAENIEKVELITNPSAKFDASSTGGIINVILKKDKKGGLNGRVAIGAGTPQRYNGNLSINYRQGKVSVFASGNYNSSEGTSKGEAFRENRKNGIAQDYFNQLSESGRKNTFKSYRFGADYFMDDHNTLSLSENITNGNFNSTEDQKQDYLDNNKQLQYTGTRSSNSNSDFNRLSSQLNYKHTFIHPGKELTADVTYNTGSGTNQSSIFNKYEYPNGNPYKASDRVNNFGGNNNGQWTIQADYVNPISETAKMETGVRSYINSYSSTYNSFAVANDGTQTKLSLSNNYKYKETINAFYFTYTNKWQGIGYQAGLRAEQSSFDGELVDSSRKFGYTYPNSNGSIFDALFPSLYLTKDVGDGQQFQLNYSRRVRRPDFWQLNPFIDINDPVNIRQGNPLLHPEFTNSFEFNYNKIYTSGSILAVLYYKNNQGDITQYSDTLTDAQYQQLNNAAVDPNAIINTYVNAQYNNRYGVELTLQQKIGNNFDFTPTFDFQYSKVKAIINHLDLSNEGFNWDTKLTLNYRLDAPASPVFNKISFQAIGRYESPSVIPQGKREEVYNMDFAMRKDFLKNNRASLVFSINDVFNTRKFGVIYDTESFYQDSYRRRDVRSFKLTFAYKFGKTDFSLFKKQEKSEEKDDQEEDGNQ